MFGSKIKIMIFIIVFLISMILCSPIKVNASNGTASPHFTGEYAGDGSIVYFSGWNTMQVITDLTYVSALLDPNVTNSQNYVFSANSIEIRANQMLNGTNVWGQIIADNESARINIPIAVKIAQEFSVNTSASINSIYLYLNYSLAGRYILVASLYEDDLTSLIDYGEWWIYSETYAGWRSFWLSSNVLEPAMTYFIVFEIIYQDDGNGGSELPPAKNDLWKAELYTNSSMNKGQSLYYNGTVWNPIPNDAGRDMLCKFDYVRIVDPYAVNLSFSINGEVITYQRRHAQWGGGYEAYFTTNFPMPPMQPINISLKADISVPTISIEAYVRYIFSIPISGQFNASYDKIEWELTYPYRNIETMGAFPREMFLFESNWDYLEFCDPYSAPMPDVYFGPITFYNKSYYGALLSLMGPWLEPGDYYGRFTSPNFCHTIQPKIKEDSSFRLVTSFELGDTIKLEASIEDNNNPVSGGLATLNFTSPTGQLIYSVTNLTALNGILSTDEFTLNENLETGIYTISVFWTNGYEVGCYSMEIEVKPQSSMLMFYLLIGILFAVAIAAYPLVVYSRRKLQTRNWEKHLRNLFILKKDGLSLYGYTFGIEIQDPTLVSAALMAISSFVSDAVKSKKGLRVIDLEDKKVILSHGEYVITALISAKDFPIIRTRAEHFTKAFEARYGGKIVDWRGDQSVFKGTDKVIQEYFPVSIEDRMTRGVKLKLIEIHERLESASEPEVLLSILSEVTQLLQRYREIIETQYMDEYSALMKLFDEKLNPKSQPQ